MASFLSMKAFAEATTIAIIAFCVVFFVRRSLNYLKESEKIQKWLRTAAETLYGPASWIILGYGLLAILEVFLREENFFMSEDAVGQIRQLFPLIAFSWLIFRFKGIIEEQFIEHSKKNGKGKGDEALIHAVGRLSSVVIFVVIGIMILEIFHVPLTGLLAFGGMGTVAVSYAGKDVIANFFGGLMIYTNRPFAKGDWIYSPNKNFEGVVEDIGWYVTRIRTFERRPMFIPNSLTIDAIVENPGRMYNRRIKANFGLRYDDVKVLKAVVDDVEKMLKEHPEIDLKQTLMVHFIEFGDSSLVIQVYCFTKTTVWATYRSVQQDVFLKIADIVAKHGAEIAFPTTTIHLHQG